jgi:hypothetical protein
LTSLRIVEPTLAALIFGFLGRYDPKFITNSLLTLKIAYGAMLSEPREQG